MVDSSKKMPASTEFQVIWSLYKEHKKATGERNTHLLADLMEAEGGFYLNKEIWRELIQILREYGNFEYANNKLAHKKREREWIFWRYFQYHNKRGHTSTEAKEMIAKEFNFSFDKVDKVIQRHWDKKLKQDSEKWEKLWKELQDKQ